MSAIVYIAQLIVQLFFFFLPAGIANMSPVFVKKHFLFLARPVDGGRWFFGAPLFGNHKTWRGLIVAVLVGGIFYCGERAVFQSIPGIQTWIAFPFSDFPWWFGFLFAFGAITGDLVKSFFKRRFHHAPGVTWFPFDQLDFLFGAAFVASFFIDFTIVMWFAIIFVGPVLHILSNRIGFILHLKDSPW